MYNVFNTGTQYTYVHHFTQHVRAATLSTAVQQGLENIVKLLLEAKVDPNLPDKVLVLSQCHLHEQLLGLLRNTAHILFTPPLLVSKPLWLHIHCLDEY